MSATWQARIGEFSPATWQARSGEFLWMEFGTWKSGKQNGIGHVKSKNRMELGMWRSKNRIGAL